MRLAGSTGRGLIGLDERVRLAGGVLHHGLTQTGSYRLAAVLPFDGPQLGTTDREAP